MKHFAAALFIIVASVYWIFFKDNQEPNVRVSRSQPMAAEAEISQYSESKSSPTSDEIQSPPERQRNQDSIQTENSHIAASNTSQKNDFSAADLNQLVEERECAGCNLKGADLSGMDLKRVNLKGANLEGANLHGTNLKNSNLEGANLSDADLSEADLTQTNFVGSNLQNTNLTRSNLTYGDVTGANFSNSILREATLTDLHMDNVNLSGADLSYTDASGVSFKDSVWTDAITKETKFIDNPKIDWNNLSIEQQCDAEIIHKTHRPDCP